MIEIILTVLFFSLIGVVLTTVFGYFYIGIFCLFIITASIVIGALILQFSCMAASAALNTSVEKKRTTGNRYPRESEIVRQDPPRQINEPQTIIQIAISPDGIESRKLREKHNQ